MLRILLCCSAGMSTSMLVSKMQSAARREGLECVIEAMSITEGKQQIDKWDVIMLGPQVGYGLKEFESITKKPVAIIPAPIYAVAKGAEAIQMAKEMAKKAGVQF
ncbi:PTS system, cellobiose-specific IIB component [Spiroplasma gladiatoris]|uniref:PTS system, cellobiose-specific IIB component n=1 Tax=Spiroplasma gladiatoris TaxID=2143 RepID=A0A4P7AGD6_9MOLU|nr:PTS sugar transporter subunit IIB [Spiroplasma gladiatoris]QBQ07425.1 PTS system, cellobiose-specific IIB component [Spiroplasma gladiatoris]